MIVPLLLVARSFSHCVQFTDRYYEILSEIGSKRRSAEITMGVMLAPSVLGIITDALGILFIGLAPIPAMQRFALFAGFWALCLIPTGVFLIAILLFREPFGPVDAVAFGLIWTALVIFTADSVLGERKARRLARAAAQLAE